MIQLLGTIVLTAKDGHAAENVIVIADDFIEFLVCTFVS
jgi:hypothetical protein